MVLFAFSHLLSPVLTKFTEFHHHLVMMRIKTNTKVRGNKDTKT